MTPDDPRHGTYAGYQAHCRDNEQPCPACHEGRYRARKRFLGAHLRGEAFTYTADQVRQVINPWLTMGMSLSAIAVAAGYGSQRSGPLHTTLAANRVVRRGTYHRLAAVTEDDFAPNARVYADLTRMRIYSLMAIGHPLIGMPINASGHWRHREHTTVDTARTVREFYAAREFTVGPSRHTAVRARNAGFVPPLSWDDPGTLAWPTLDRRKRSRTKPAKPAVVDAVVVQRLLAGDRVRSSRAEKEEAMRLWLAAGRTQRSLCAVHGWAEGRYATASERVA